MPFPCASAGPESAISSPRTRVDPASGRSTPHRILISVLLPAPFSPTSAWISPKSAANDASRSARTPPKDFETPLASMADAASARRRPSRSSTCVPVAASSGEVDLERPGAGLAGERGLDADLHRGVRTGVREVGEEAVGLILEHGLALLDRLPGDLREWDRDVTLGVLPLLDRSRQLERDHAEIRRLADRQAVDGLLALVARQELAEAVLRLARGRGERALGVDERLQHAVGAALRPDAVDLGQRRQLRRRVALRGGGVPHARVAAHDLHPGVLLEDGHGALVAVGVDARARDARDHDHVALAVELLDQELRELLAELRLVGVDLQRARLGHDVVERDDEDLALAGLPDHSVEAGRRRGVEDDGVDVLGDQVRDLLRLLAHVVAGVEDAAVDLVLVRRHRARGLERVGHLDAPLVADVGVREGDLELLAPVTCARRPAALLVVVPAAARGGTYSEDGDEDYGRYPSRCSAHDIPPIHRTGREQSRPWQRRPGPSARRSSDLQPSPPSTLTNARRSVKAFRRSVTGAGRPCRSRARARAPCRPCGPPSRAGLELASPTARRRGSSRASRSPPRAPRARSRSRAAPRAAAWRAARTARRRTSCRRRS